MTTLLPKDADNNLIPAMRLKSGGAHAISATSSSARNASGFSPDTKVVSVYATGAGSLNFGSSTGPAANTDHYFPTGVDYDFAISGGDTKGPHNTHLAVLAAGGNCTVYVSEKE